MAVVIVSAWRGGFPFPNPATHSAGTPGTQELHAPKQQTRNERNGEETEYIPIKSLSARVSGSFQDLDPTEDGKNSKDKAWRLRLLQNP